jgi:hypothetical protein
LERPAEGKQIVPREWKVDIKQLVVRMPVVGISTRWLPRPIGDDGFGGATDVQEFFCPEGIDLDLSVDPDSVLRQARRKSI